MVVFSENKRSTFIPKKNKRSTYSVHRVNVSRFTENARRVQSQNSEPGKIKVAEEKPIETPEEWVISIKDKMDKACRDVTASSWDKLCIYRVPNYLQENDKKSYLPQTVSLGPYHHGNKHLLPMECHKWRAVNMALKRTEKGIETYIDAMKELEEKARACYQGPIDEMSINEFTEMLVLDGCFVLELFRGNTEGFTKIGYASNDPVFTRGGLMHCILRDMVMLENQLPLFVLDKLLELQLGAEYEPGSVAQSAVKFFDSLMPAGKELTKRVQSVYPPSDDGELHCLGVFHRSLFLSKPNQKINPKFTSPRKQQLIHCVTELKEAGVKFRRKETDKLWDIEFKNGYLKIPKLLIHDGTKSLFSNLIAFEQCHANSSNNITSYIIFMDNLINSAEDVSYLHHCDIIEHWLGSDFEVADLFNRLCKEVAFDPEDSYLSQLSGEVNRYYSRKWNTLKATLRHNYFNNPWAYFSFSAALVLLILTFLQTFFAVYAYYKPSS